jgi:hypothetical protein
MNFDQKTVTVTESSLISINTDRKALKLKVTGADIYIGETGLSASDGFLIEQGIVFNLSVPTTTAEIFALTASGTATVYVSEDE